MRMNSEEPSNGIRTSNTTTLSPAFPPSPTPRARSPPSSFVPNTAATGGGGVPLTLGGVQRQPSLKARDAFNRLRIGSFGATSSNKDSSPSSTVEPMAVRTLSPDDWTRSSEAEPQAARNERNSSAPPSSQPYSATSTSTTASPIPGMGMSPAASFLSSFSPNSAPTSTNYNSSPNSHSNHAFARRVQGQGGGGLNLLPPKGDEAGFVLPFTSAQVLGETNEDEDEREEGEWVLGKELGSGGMGVVREVIWRSKSTTPRVQGGRQAKRKKRRRIAVKIVRQDLFSAGGGGNAGAGSALEAFGLSPRNQPPWSAERGQRPFPGSTTARATSFQWSLPSSDQSTALRNPSKDRLLGNSFSPGGFERNRSTSSPIKPPSHLLVSATAASRQNVTGSSTLSPIEQSPLPSPSLGDRSSSPVLEVVPSPEQTLLLALLNRELTLWSHITSRTPPPTTTHQPHPNIVPLLSTFELAEFSYIFMPLCDGGSLLSYLNSPPSNRDDPPLELVLSSSNSSSTDRSHTPSTSSSRSRDRSTSTRGRTTLPRMKPRTSLPFASSITSSPSASNSLSSSTRTSRFLSPPPQPQERALTLERAGEVFAEIVNGLKWLHEEKGVVHKDFKLENLLSVWEKEQDSESGDDEDETSREKEQRDGDRSRSRGRQERWKRVWKLADFGLSEIMQSSSSGATASSPTAKKVSSPVLSVPPLSTLARGGSLNRPNKHSQLSLSVGPSSNTSNNNNSSHTTHTPRFPPTHHSSILVPPPSSSSSSESPLIGHLHPIGSLPYSSPESIRSPIPIIHPSVDIWALGCVLYAMVEGVLPIWDEWEYRLRTRLIKGEWEIPENLRVRGEDSDEARREKNLVLEVLKGCLEKKVEERWDIDKVVNSEWLRFVKSREEERKNSRRRTRRNARSLLKVDTAKLEVNNVDTEMNVLDLPPSPARGRPSTTRPLLPVLSALSYPSSPSHSTPVSASTSTSRSSSSRSLSRSSSHNNDLTTTRNSNRPSPVSQEPLAFSSSLNHSQGHSTPRRPSRSTSRSSAYSHSYGVDSRTQMEELKERGRSQRRLRWDEEKETSRRRRSESRDALEGGGLGLEESLNLTARGRSSSRSSLTSKGSGKGKSRERGSGAGERLETVRDEPY
ncbi:uncharacterized protein JCM6883_004019 [Sporobolomyces salmoneus]|uniref:uncharacterized protein n=1 Tax=Sporobolomyces salmoneus TaxID=183962 RepID=UPI00317ED3B4